MDFIKRNAKRVATDAAGYLLIVAAILTGWLPGPGGIPLALAGLGLLSINNKWAKDLRDWLLANGGKLVEFLFPRNRFVEWLYDIVVILLLVLTGFLEARHAAIWQISLGVAAFFIALFIALMNRERLKGWRGKHKR
jgi:hypothetical protein